MKYRILSMLVSNQFGVLTRVTNLFSRRGFNIKELTVGETDNPAISRITVLTEGGDEILEQIQKQLAKLEDVKVVTAIPADASVSRELLLIKISLLAGRLAAVRPILDQAGANILHSDEESLVAEITGETEEIDSFIQQMKPYGILELCRTGVTALTIGRGTIYDTK
jgi:acetolactate synthase-1/3 small subunit